MPDPARQRGSLRSTHQYLPQGNMRTGMRRDGASHYVNNKLDCQAGRRGMLLL